MEKPVPVPPVPAGGGQNGGVFQIQVQQFQPAPGQVQVEVGFAAMGPGGRSIGGLTLVDNKGQGIPTMSTQTRGRFAGGQMSYEYTMTYRLAKGQQPAKLIFSGHRTVNLDIPFTLKDVPLK
jgi:hypothetical protein